jgi:cytochrome c
MRGVASHATRLLGALALIAATTAAHAQGDAALGEKRFEECASCHTTVRGENGVGPSLFGVLDRKAGAIDEFRYSPAMKRSGITWTAKSLDEFVADPQKMVPGNRMPYAGLPDARERANLLAYLQKVAK